jgi:FkbH-like protein
LIWDLDNTIWDGILSEGDAVTLKEGIVEILSELDSRGVLHSIASKNNYDKAMERLREYGIDHFFIYPEINWNPKSTSIANIQKNLNLGIDSFVFIDDQQFERDEVKFTYPAMECLDAGEYVNLLTMPRFYPKFITEDSKNRRLLYMRDIERKNEEEIFEGTSEEFLKNLNMKFLVFEAKEEDLKRIEELTIRTHQLNSTGISFGYNELMELIASPDHSILVCELIDKYGTYGKIGLAMVGKKPDYWHLKLLLMSCRVVSRGVGNVLLTHIGRECKKDGKPLLADFKQTDRNRMMLITYKFSGFREIETCEDGYILFKNDLSTVQNFPDYLEVSIV